MLRGVALCLLGSSVLLAGCATPDEAPGPDAGTPEEPAAVAPPPIETRAEEPQIDLAPLREAVAAAPDDPAARRRLGIALYQSRMRDEAVEQFERGLEIQRSARSLLDLALAYGSVSRLDDAERLYGELLEEVPGHPIALHNMGNLTYKRGDLERSIDFYRRAIAARPNYLLAHSHLAGALAKADQPLEAYKTYQAVLGLEPTTAEELQAFDDALYQMAAIEVKRGGYERAGRMLEELLQANPKHASAHYLYGRVLLQAGQNEAAEREFQIHMRILDEIRPTGPVATTE
jgi:tetratricopeptide (TPR) repeat protein